MSNKAARLARLNDAYHAVRDYLLTLPRWEWTTQSKIKEATGVSGVTMRQVCQMYPSSFIGGLYGYKLALYATSAEIQHAVASLLSRAEKITRRASALSGRLA